MLYPEPVGETAKKFENWWHWTDQSLRILLGYEIHLERTQFPLEKMLKNCLRDFRSGKSSSVIVLAQLRSLTLDLEFLRVKHFQHYQSFKSKLLSGPAKQYEYLTGVWFEIQITRMFLEKGFEYQCPDPPDFDIRFEGKNLSIECYSPRIDEGTIDYQKLTNSILTRKVKKYKNSAWIKNYSILFIDGTWLIRSLSNGILERNYTIPKEIKVMLSDLHRESFYKLIVIFISGHLIESGQNGSTISCIYTPNVISEETLSSFLKRLLTEFKEEKGVKIWLPHLPKQ